jgi:hypothetical protein
MKERALEEENRRLRQQHEQRVAEWQPSPYEQALNQEGVDWLKATSGETPLDISKLPGMAPYLDMYKSAVAKQQGQRVGLGMFRDGAASANPNLIASLAQQEEAHRRQDAGNQLNTAFALRNAEVRGSALPLINIGEGRAAGRAGLSGQMSNNAANRWAQHQVRPGFWSRMLDNAVQGASAAAVAA